MAAISAGRPTRPKGVLATASSRNFGSRISMSVCGARGHGIDGDAAGAKLGGEAARAGVDRGLAGSICAQTEKGRARPADEVLITRPHSGSSGAVARVIAATPKTLTAKIFSKCSGVASFRVAMSSTPALLTRMSIRPKAPRAAAAILAGPSFAPTSPGARTASPPSLLDAAHDCLRSLLRRRIVDRHLGAVLGQSARDGGADPPRSSGDERDLAFQWL